MQKTAPAIYRSKEDPKTWGWVEYGDLLECANNLRVSRAPFGPVELFRAFCAMNIFQASNGKFDEISALVQTGGWDCHSGPLREALIWIFEKGELQDWTLFVPAQWATRVLEALRRGGYRAKHEPPALMRKGIRSRVSCFDENGAESSFVM